MDVARPYTAVCPTLDSTVLAVLAGTTKPLTGREVARLAGRSSHSGVLDVLNRLAEHGLVDRAEAGRAMLFTLNREHLAAPAVTVLATMRDELHDRIRGALDAWTIKPVHLSMFGSAARADGDVDSDIDLFVVRPSAIAEDDGRWRDQLGNLSRRVERWTGNRVGIAEMHESELARLSRRDSPIGAELRSDAIRLHGPEVTQLLEDAG